MALGLAAAAFIMGAPLAQDMQIGERIAVCAACHGVDGNSRMANTPSLAGQPEYSILDQLIYMREGVRDSAVMAPFVKGLTDADARALARHFSGLTPKASDEPVDPDLVARGASLAERRRCASCHGPRLAGQEQVPRLARQRVDYMFKAMKEMRDDKRRSADTLMTAAIYGLSDDDLLALAHYAASR